MAQLTSALAARVRPNSQSSGRLPAHLVRLQPPLILNVRHHLSHLRTEARLRRVFPVTKPCRHFIACGAAVVVFLIVGCDTPGKTPLVKSQQLALELTDRPIPETSGPFAAAKDVRSSESRLRINAAFGERYGDADFAQHPLDAIRAEIAHAASMRLFASRTQAALAGASFELHAFEASYTALSVEELDRQLAKQPVPAFWLLDRAAVTLTGRQGTILLSITASVNGKVHSVRELIQVGGEPPPGKYFFVPYMQSLARQLLSEVSP
jgi:hypothetical protein